MCPPIPVTPRCAAHCGRRIDLIPSRRVAAAALAWLAIVFGMTLGALALPLPARIGLCVAVAMCVGASIHRCILLRGAWAIRALEWAPDGVLTVQLGTRAAPLAARLAAGTFRLGLQIVVLRLETAIGARVAVVDGTIHDAAAFRDLCRRLECLPRRASGRGSHPN